MANKDLSGLREEIDRIDRELLSSLSRRAELAQGIGRLKAEEGRPVHDPEREAQVLAALCRDNQGPLPDAALRGIMGAVMASCRAVQERPRASYLGPEGTFSHQAALEIFGPAAELRAEGAIRDVFRSVESGNGRLGLVPAENSTEGGVNATMDLLQTTKAKIRGEHFLSIRHALLSCEPDLSSLKRIYSHPQALSQCRSWLGAHLPEAELVEASSTARAAHLAAQEEKAGAVGCEILARLGGLKVLAPGIQDQESNQTRFLILGREDQPPTGRDRTSLLIRARHVPGSLSRCLIPLARAGLNLTRIESRPVPDKPWEYVFFLDIQGHRLDPEVEGVLAELSAQAQSVRVLGSYPRADNYFNPDNED